MSEGISAWAIRHPTPVVLLFIGLTIAGLVALAGLPVKQFPDISFAFIRVTVLQPGAAASELETRVTRPVENAVFGISDVDSVRSTVSNGVSLTMVAFELGVETDLALEKVRTAIDTIRTELPTEIEAPVIERLELDDIPIATYTIAAPELSLAELSYFIDDTIARRLMAVAGVARIVRLGGADREVNVVLDSARLAALGVTAPEINDALRRFHVDASGGRTRIGDVEQTVRVLGAAETVEALRAFPIPTREGQTQLGELASVGDGIGEERQLARLDGRPVVGFQVMKTKEGSEVDVEDGVNLELARLTAAFPNIALERIASIVDDTRKSLAATTEVLLEGMLLAALIVYLFLREWRSTLIAALAMPLSLIPTFAVMALLGFSLNMLTLLALTLVIGILVDDAIVEIENIQKRVERGASPYRAALVGGDAIGLAVVATTFSIVVVFAPVSFMPGIGGQFFKEFGATVAISVLFSLVVARLLTPLLAAYFLRGGGAPVAPAKLGRTYLWIADWTLRHRLASLGLGGLIFVASLGIAATLPSGFMPQNDSGNFQLVIRGSPGAVRETMARSIDELTQRLRAHPDVERVFAAVGGAAYGDDLRSGGAIVVLREDRALTTDQVKAELRPSLRSIPDALVVTFGGIAGSAADVEIILTSENREALDASALRLQRELRGVEGISDIRTGSPPPGPELVVRPRAHEAARLGVASESIAEIVRVATVGETDARTPKLTVGERRIPVRVRLPAAEAGDLVLLRSLHVPTADGQTTPLASVADLSFQAGPPTIERFDRARLIAVQADLVPGYTLGQATDAANALPALRELPDGVRNAAYGDSEAMAELFGGFAMAMAAAVGLIFAVLVLLFGGFTKPLVILSALPLSLAGAFVSLAIFRMPIELPVLIGLLMLMGIAAKNSILLVEFALEREREGASRTEALTEARRERTRPILMTTYAMAAGMLPAALGVGDGSEIRQAMAVAVVGGLVSSTALSLVLVPVVYSLVADAEEWLAPRLGKLVTPVSAEDRA